MNYIIEITVPESELAQYLPLWPINDEGKEVRMKTEHGLELAAYLWLLQWDRFETNKQYHKLSVKKEEPLHGKKG